MASLKPVDPNCPRAIALQFHDRAVVASLKRGIGVVGAGSVQEFHDRAVVASLKRGEGSAVAAQEAQFHDRAVVASLKRVEECQPRRIGHNSTTARSWPH